MNVGDLVRENIKRLKPFSAARSEFQGFARVLLDANESPFESSFNRYPDPYQRNLKSILAKQKGLSTDQIILGNGSDELIDLIVRTFCRPSQDVMRYIEPSFGMYPVAADINDILKEPVFLNDRFDLDVENCLKNQTDRHKLIFLCSPNNPTGNSLDHLGIIRIIREWKGIVVLDEAYIEFCEQPSLLGRLDEFENLIVLQTFSKALGGAGLRLGMGFASQQIVGFLNKIKPPYNVNIHTQQEAMRILSDPEQVKTRIKFIKAERQRLADHLLDISGVIRVYPSDANFLLVKCKNHFSLYQNLCQKGIIVRDRSRLHGCEQCLRMTVGLAHENDELVNEISTFYNQD